MQYCPIPNKNNTTNGTTDGSNSDDSILHLEFLGCIDDKDEDMFEGSEIWKRRMISIRNDSDEINKIST